MKSLDQPASKTELLDRLRHITPRSQRQWGKMTSHQMICHLNDSFKACMGEKSVSRADNLFSRTVMRWAALHVPLTWPKGVKTRPEMDQQAGGTQPVEFQQDLSALASLIELFSQPAKAAQRTAHPVFGKMTEWEWQRWGYLHVDHHLRQFGA